MLGAFSSRFPLRYCHLVRHCGLYEPAGLSQAGTEQDITVLLMGMGLLLVGLGSKGAGVPLHMWAPDVEGVPTAVTAFMTAVPGAASRPAAGVHTQGFRCSVFARNGFRFAVLAALTMLLGIS